MIHYDRDFLLNLEEALLASILVCDSDSVREFFHKHNLVPSDFTWEYHQYLYQAILNCWKDGVKADVVSIEAYKPKQCHDPDVIKQWTTMNIAIADKHISIATLEHTMMKFKEFRIMRYWLTVGNNVLNMDWSSRNVLETADKIVSNYHKLFHRLTSGLANTGGYVDELTQKYLNNQAGISPAIPSGCKELDELLGGGLYKGELIVIAGRPGQLKTTTGLAVAYSAYKQGHAVVFVSVEMPENQIKSKIIAKETGISYERIKKGDINSDELGLISDCSYRLERSNFDIVGDKRNIRDIIAHIRKRRKEGMCDLVVVDHIHVVTHDHKNFREGVTEISRELKNAAKENNVPVIALSQLNREVDKRDVPRPFISDLKESSSIEEDADIIIFPYREAHYMKKKNPQASINPKIQWRVELNLGKGRDVGIKGDVFWIDPAELEIVSYGEKNFSLEF